MFFEELAKYDSEVYASCERVLQRQRNSIVLFEAGSRRSIAVWLDGGTVLTNKYAEGYPSKRYYGGCV